MLRQRMKRECLHVRPFPELVSALHQRADSRVLIRVVRWPWRLQSNSLGVFAEVQKGGFVPALPESSVENIRHKSDGSSNRRNHAEYHFGRYSFAASFSHNKESRSITRYGGVRRDARHPRLACANPRPSRDSNKVVLETTTRSQSLRGSSRLPHLVQSRGVLLRKGGTPFRCFARL